MTVHDCIQIALTEGPEKGLDTLLSEKARNPFQHEKRGFLGPGPSGYVHLPAEVPWDCQRLEPYTHRCVKKDPSTGKTTVKNLFFDPEKVLQRNRKYRQWARTQRQNKRQGVERIRPGDPMDAMLSHPRVKFDSNIPKEALRDKLNRLKDIEPADLAQAA